MKKILVSTLLSSLLLTGSLVADTNTSLSSKELSKKATQVETKKIKDNKVELIQEALSSLKLSVKALKNLEENKKEDAKKNLELALGKLEVILTSKDVPKILPIENRMLVKNFVGSSKDVERALSEVKTLLSKGKVQEAGELLITLQDEVEVKTVNLPLATYPDALKLVSKYILEDKIDEAKATLTLALNTFITEETIVPLSLVKTLELVSVASHEAKENKKLALTYLASAHDELNKAEKLGYLSDSSTTYKELQELINGLEKEIKGANKAEKLFEEAIKTLKEFKSKILSSDSNESKK